MFAFYQRLGVSVYASNRDVIRRTRATLAQGVLRDPRFRAARKELYRAVLLEHQKALDLVVRFRL